MIDCVKKYIASLLIFIFVFFYICGEMSNNSISMMKWFSLFCFLLYTNIYSLYSQIYTPGGGDPLGYAHKIDTLDTYNIQVKYEMKFMPDTLARDNYNKITTVCFVPDR